MTHAAWQLKEAIYTKLTTDTTLMTLIEGVFDFVPDASVYPYVVISDIVSKDWSSLASIGASNEVTLEVFCRERGSIGCFEIADRVKILLHHTTLNLSSDTNVHSRLESLAVERQEDGLTHHADMQFIMLTKE